MRFRDHVARLRASLKRHQYSTPWFVLAETLAAFRRHNGLSISASLSFYALFALIPMALLLFFLMSHLVFTSDYAIVELAIITARTSQLMVHRSRNLGITHLYQGAEDKLEAYQHLLAELNMQPEHIAYMGDDVVDLPVMRRCGLAITVPAAPDIVKQHSHHVTALPGGRGAVREVCELIMHAQDTFDAQMAPYLR